MRAAIAAWTAAGHRVVPLATSAMSAQVLSAELGVRAENLHKYLYEHHRPQPNAQDAEFYRLGAGDVLLVDEAGMAGALRLLATEVGAVELTHLHRFTTPAEAAATLRLRAGDPAAVGHYQRTGRLRGGSRDAMLDQAYAAWAHDTARGLRSVLVTAGGPDAAALNGRARLDRIAHGHVHAGGGVEPRDGGHAGVGTGSSPAPTSASRKPTVGGTS